MTVDFFITKNIKTNEFDKSKYGLKQIWFFFPRENKHKHS